MDRFQIIVLVILVGIQVFRALKKKLDAPVPVSDEMPQDLGEPDRQPNYPAQEKMNRPISAASTPEARRPASAPTRGAELKRAIVPAGKSFSRAQDSLRRERLRQSVLGKVILDPPPGLVRLRQIKP